MSKYCSRLIVWHSEGFQAFHHPYWGWDRCLLQPLFNPPVSSNNSSRKSRTVSDQLLLWPLAGEQQDIHLYRLGNWETMPAFSDGGASCPHPTVFLNPWDSSLALFVLLRNLDPAPLLSSSESYSLEISWSCTAESCLESSSYRHLRI